MFNKKQSLGERAADALFDMFLPQKQGMSEKKARLLAALAAGMIAAGLAALFGVKERDAQ